MANNNKNNLPLESQTNAQKVKQQNAQANQNAAQAEFGSEFGVSLEAQTNAQEVKQQNAQANQKAQAQRKNNKY